MAPMVVVGTIMKNHIRAFVVDLLAPSYHRWRKLENIIAN